MQKLPCKCFLSFDKMHTLAIYNLKNWELAFSLSNSSFKLELGLWDSIESRVTGKENTEETVQLQSLRSQRIMLQQLLVRRKGSTCREKSHYANDSTKTTELTDSCPAGENSCPAWPKENKVN